MPDTITSIDITNGQTIDVKAIPGTSDRDAGMIRVRRVGCRLCPPDWFSIGMKKVRPLVGALTVAEREPDFRQDLPWYGDQCVLRVWRWPAKPNPGEIVLLEIHREKPDGTYVFTGLKGARLEIPLPYVGRVRSAISTAWRNLGGRLEVSTIWDQQDN